MKILEHNVETGIVVERDATKEELAQYKIDFAEWASRYEEEEQRENKKIQLLEKLGLSEDEARVLLG